MGRSVSLCLSGEQAFSWLGKQDIDGKSSMLAIEELVSMSSRWESACVRGRESETDGILAPPFLPEKGGYPKLRTHSKSNIQKPRGEVV